MEEMGYGFSMIFTRLDVDANVDVNVDAKPIIRQKWILEQIKQCGGGNNTWYELK